MDRNVPVQLDRWFVRASVYYLTGLTWQRILKEILKEGTSWNLHHGNNNIMEFSKATSWNLVRHKFSYLSYFENKF